MSTQRGKIINDRVRVEVDGLFLGNNYQFDSIRQVHFSAAEGLSYEPLRPISCDGVANPLGGRNAEAYII